MTRLLLRSLLHYWRTNAAVLAGVATAVAVLAGALLVGQSVRSSLQDLLVERIGAPVHVVPGSRFNFKITTIDDLHAAEMLVDRTPASAG